MRIGNIVLNLVSVALVGAGLALICTFFFGPAFLNPDVNAGAAGANPKSFNVPTLQKQSAKNVAPDTASAKKTPDKKPAAQGPEDKTLRITIPKMNRIENSVVPAATGKNEDLLRKNAGIHLKGTGNPWEKGANVYIAGHRLGYPSTDSFLSFFDLNKLEDGDKVFLTDSEGKKYTYKVYKEFVVDPSDVSVTRPVKGKDVLTLQTCTLPDYSQRLIVRAERVS